MQQDRKVIIDSNKFNLNRSDLEKLIRSDWPNLIKNLIGFYLTILLEIRLTRNIIQEVASATLRNAHKQSKRAKSERSFTHLAEI